MKTNNIKYFLIGLLIILPSLFNSESFLFIRYYSLMGSISLFLIHKTRNRQNINMPVFFILTGYLITCALYYNFSVNSYNIRMHFAEYGFYMYAMLIIASIDWNARKLFKTLSHALIVSGLIQIAYSLGDLGRGAGRIEGNTAYPNFLSLLLIAGLAASIYLIIEQWIREKNKWGIVYIMPLLILLFGIFRTGSRNILILIPLMLFTVVFFYRKKWALIGLAAAVIIIVLVPSHSKYRLLHEKENNPYGVQRINIYKQVTGIAARHPLGIGYNNLQYFTLQNNFPVEGRVGRYAANARIAHNEYLEWLVNTGLAGIILFVILLFYIIRFIGRNKLNNALNKLVLTLIILFAIMSLFDNALYLPYNAMPLFICMGLLFNGRTHGNRPVMRYAVIIMLICLWIVNITDIYAHHRINKINRQLKNSEMDVSGYRNINNELSLLHVITGKPQYVVSQIRISEILYNKTNEVQYFQHMLDNYNYLFKSYPMEFTHYLSYARLLQKYRHSLLRMNDNLPEKIDRSYGQAIQLCPFNPFYRYEYSRFLLSEEDTAAAVSQLNTAIQNEPNFISGINVLYNITGNKLYERQLDSIYKNYKNLSDNAVTDYERMLLK